MAFTKVTREKSKLRLALAAPSGAGKTLSALYIAYGITEDWSKIALIDTEHGRAKFYANRSDLGTGEFLYQEMTAPFTPEKYMAMVAEGCAAVGSDGVVIIDSFSHAWDSNGGVLDIKSEIAKRQGKTEFSAWDEAGKIQNSLVNTILSTKWLDMGVEPEMCQDCVQHILPFKGVQTSDTFVQKPAESFVSQNNSLDDFEEVLSPDDIPF